MKLQITEGQPSENLLHIIDMAAHANTHWSESHSLIPEKSWNIIKLIENTIKNTDKVSAACCKLWIHLGLYVVLSHVRSSLVVNPSIMI